MAKFQKKPVVAVVDAFQYGQDGHWQEKSVQRLVEFITGKIGLPEHKYIDYVHPEAQWDPPLHASLRLWVVKSHGWCELEIGDWVIKEADGVGVYPCKREIFEATYEPV